MVLGVRLRRLLWRLRRMLVDAWGAFLTAGCAGLIGAGWFPDVRDRQAEAAPVIVACALGLLVLGKLVARLRAPAFDTPRWKTETGLARATAEEESRGAKKDLELGAALIVATYVTLQMTGGLRSPVYPLIYAITAFVITFHRRSVGIPLLLVTLALEWLLYRAANNPRAYELMLSHAAFIGFFGLVHLVF